MLMMARMEMLQSNLKQSKKMLKMRKQVIRVQINFNLLKEERTGSFSIVN